ncbi:MAG: leucine-rich repeat domain-containing protein [Oscillospiraceae bacterium]|nr:leucine-rich repeat domain-containing protein [Oscillospiraceae bacterium]
MKKVLKYVVPILLVIVILASLVWYGFVYDREFTRDMMLKQARFFLSNGNHAIASWFYDLAYEFSAQDEDVAIELANQFKKEGNYTKAEYTLSNAIADGGTADLYVALCKTYVEQNKLLDAVNMLNNISDPSIKAQLDAMRPAAPVSDPEPGFYSQYISVSLTASEGTLYYSTNGEYPSIDDVPYSEPFTLPGGETTVYAIAVAKNGLVSPLSVMGFTIGGVIEEVILEDAAIDREVRASLNLGAEETLFTNQLWNITSFTVPSDASNMNDISKMPYLEKLVIQDEKLENLQFLTGLSFLEELDLSGSRFGADQISAIAALPSLQKLTLNECSISTVAGLEAAQNLTFLDLGNNTVRNLTPLAGLTALKEINLEHNAVTDLTALSGLSNLEKLNVSYNSLVSLSPLAENAKLTWLNANNNDIRGLNGVERLTALTYLAVSHNALTEISLVSGCTNLVELHMASNQVTDISPVISLKKLETLDFAKNQVASLPAFSDDATLRTIDGSYNQITSLASLKNQQNLSHVFMDYNLITDVGVLENCYNLTMINVYGNAVTGVEKLTAHDIIVNYDPTGTSATEGE